jgi:tRNA A37 methylthiotransferase MiaB
MKRLDLVLVSESDDVAQGLAPTAMDGYLRSRPYLEYFTSVGSRLRLPDPGPMPVPQQLGLAALGTWVRRAGFSVSVHDSVFRDPGAGAEFLASLDRDPRIVGISTPLLVDAASVRRLVEQVRERRPRALLVLGGFSAERRPEFRELADATVIGPGEKPLVELLACLKAGADWRRLDNLCYFEGGREVRTPARLDLHPDEVPPPDWELLSIRPSLCYPVQASKGCRYACAFCGCVGPGRQRMRSIPLVVAEIERNFERYGVRFFRFIDTNLTSWPEHAERLCLALAAKGLPVEWGCFARIDDLARRPSLSETLRRAGCRWVFAGMESGSDAILHSMGKGYTRQAILQGVRIARSAGLRVHGNFIIGFPGETRATVDETLEVVSQSAPDLAAFFLLSIDEGTDAAIARHRERYGLRGRWDRWSHATMDSSEALREIIRCMDAVTHGPGETAIGNENHWCYHLRGFGLSEDESLNYFRSFRLFHRAERSADADAAQSALADIRRLILKIHDFWRTAYGRTQTGDSSRTP